MSKKKNGKTDTTAGAIKKLQESYECAGRGAGKFLEILRSQLRFVTEFVYPPDTDKEIGLSLKMDEYVECVNALLSTYLKNNKDKIRQDIDGQSLQQKIMLVELTKLFHTWNEHYDNKIDLNLFDTIIDLGEEDDLFPVIKSVQECIDDIEILFEYESSYDEDDMYDSSARALYHYLLGNTEHVSFDHIRPDDMPLQVNLISIKNAVTFYDLWSLFDYDDFRIFIDWGTEINLPVELKKTKLNSKKGNAPNTYIARLSKYHQNIEDFKSIKAYLTENRTQLGNESDYDIILKRVEAISYIISYLIEKTKQERELIETQAKLEERNRILANLSHSIKNMLKAVIDPLINLREEIPQKAVIIDNAIKGANLIREIVNAINLSFQTTLEELKWDVLNPGCESMTLQDMVVDSLRYSVSNMFDSRYFPAFSEKYFPRSLAKVQYEKIRSNWNEVSAGDIPQIKGFLDKHMFRLELNLDESQDYHVGNDKSSAIKLLILFQEIIFNAVKYTAYVPFWERRVELTLASNGDKMVLAVKNSFDPKVQAKTTGVGKLVIENFAKVLGCDPVITEGKDTYSIALEFDNLWQRIAADA